MLPATISKEQRIFPGNRKPVLEVICPHQCNQPLGSLASISRKLLDGGPYGSAFGTRMVVHPEFATGFSYRLRSSIAPAAQEVAALCAENGAIVIFNVIEGVMMHDMRLGRTINYGYIASKGGLKKAEKVEDDSKKLDVMRRAIEVNGLCIVSLVCYEATLALHNARPDQIILVSSYGFPEQQALHNVSAGRAFIVNDLLGKKACGQFREGDFWVRKMDDGVTYFWLWE